MGRVDEARHILAVVRTPNTDEDDIAVNQELFEIMEVVEVERQNRHLNGYLCVLPSFSLPFRSSEKLIECHLLGGVLNSAMMFGNDSYHLRRRVWLVIWLQIMQELVGIGVSFFLSVSLSLVFLSEGSLSP
jgi:hypothetical protein